MTTYFIRRLMLVPVTFLAITFMVYAILRIVPGGPIEQAEAAMKLQAASGEGGRGGGVGDEGGLQLDEGALRQLEEYYALDRSIPVGYLQWLGLWPREKLRRVPPVSRIAHADAVTALEAARKAVDDAEAALAEALHPEDGASEDGASEEWVEVDGSLGRIVAEGDVPEDVRTEAELLVTRTFGARYPLHAFLSAKGLLWRDGRYARATPRDAWPPAVAERLDALVSARKAEQAKVAETGYFLGDDGKPVQLAFRPLLQLNAARAEATERIASLLQPRGQVVSQGRIYQPMDEEEGDAFAKTDVGEDAEELVRDGFGKRDELLAVLRDEGLTWHAGEYFRELSPAKRAEDPPLYESIDTLIATRLVANAQLAQAKEDSGFEVTDEGRVYEASSGLGGVLQLDFGQSYTYNEPVLGLIGSRIKISLWFGLTGYILTWIVCVPLGVFKAVKHRSFFDTASSVVVFLGYSFPGFVLCILLLTKANDWGLPLGGFEPDNIEELSGWEAVLGRARHMVIPVAGYMVASFAAMTILMKNSLLENLGQDYVRTAFAKGLSEKRVIFVHALRNSLIPITAGIGHALGLLFAGSFLIEKACNIPGMGLLGYEAILQRDYPIILALLVFLVLIQLFGNILSDIIWAIIDPRIRFG